jgi:hypothetical protein
MGRRQARSRSVCCGRASENGNEGRSYALGDRSYCWWWPSSDERSPHGIRSAGSLDAEGRVIGVENPWVVVYRSYPCDDGAGASPKWRGRRCGCGESGGLAQKLLP